MSTKIFKSLNLIFSSCINFKLLVNLTPILSIIFLVNISRAYTDKNYNFDFLTFRATEENKTRLEIFSEIPTQNLSFRKVKFGNQAKYTLAIQLLNDSKEIVHQSVYTDSVSIHSLHLIVFLKPHLIKFAFILPPGEYRVYIKLTEFDSFTKMTFEKSVNVPDYSKPGLQLSDLQLSSSVSRAKVKSELVKNNWKIIPNVSHLFGMEAHTLYVYCELYNLSQVPGKMEQGLISTFTVKNSKGEEIKSLTIDNLKFSHQTVLLGKIPIHNLSTGRYHLQLNVTDLDSGESIEKSAVFNVVNANWVMQKI